MTKIKKYANYFSHDYRATSDTKIIKMASKWKSQGIGLYWTIVENLHDEPNENRNTIEMMVIRGTFETPETVTNFITDCIEDYKLFYMDGERLCSERVNRNLEKMVTISELRSELGRKGMENRWGKSTKEVIKKEENKVVEKYTIKQQSQAEEDEFDEIFSQYEDKKKMTPIQEAILKEKQQNEKKVL